MRNSFKMLGRNRKNTYSSEKKHADGCDDGRLVVGENDKEAGCDESCINLAVYLQHDNKRLAAQKARNFWASLCVRFRRKTLIHGDE